MSAEQPRLPPGVVTGDGTVLRGAFTLQANSVVRPMPPHEHACSRRLFSAFFCQRPRSAQATGHGSPHLSAPAARAGEYIGAPCKKPHGLRGRLAHAAGAWIAPRPTHTARDRPTQPRVPRPPHVAPSQLRLTDGVQDVVAVESVPIRELKVDSVGVKILVRDVPLRHGVLMLAPENVRVLGGSVCQLRCVRSRRLPAVRLTGSAGGSPSMHKQRYDVLRLMLPQAGAAATSKKYHGQVPTRKPLSHSLAPRAAHRARVRCLVFV